MIDLNDSDMQNYLSGHEGCCSDPDCNEPHVPIQRTAPKLGRNDPCKCGSGQKYKKCCARRA